MFAAIAAMVMVSVSYVFASSRMVGNAKDSSRAYVYIFFLGKSIKVSLFK